MRPPKTSAPPVAGGDDLLPPADVATWFGVTEKTLANWRHLGKGPKYLKVGQVRYRRRDVADWLDTR